MPAALKTSGEDVVVTTDAIIEGVHFLPDDPPDTIARKALRVNLSDLAAKGAQPAGFVLTLALRSADEAWLKPFAQALGEDAAAVMGAGNLGAGNGRGAGVRMDLQHRSDLPLSGLDQTVEQVAIRGNSMPHRVPTMFRDLTTGTAA